MCVKSVSVSRLFDKYGHNMLYVGFYMLVLANIVCCVLSELPVNRCVALFVLLSLLNKYNVRGGFSKLSY